MSEMVKSSIFLGLALILVGAAGYVQYANSWSTDTGGSGGIEFAINDPSSIAGLEIVQFDDASAKLNAFQVRQVNGVWSVPSHDNYPADAETTHLAEAATALINMEVIGDSVASKPSEHSEFGVVEPIEANTTKSGLGTMVTLSSESGERLARLIIGNPDAKNPALRYVRVPGQDLVYVAKIDTRALTTRLQDWVEADLLKINTLDIASIIIDDYSFDEQRLRQIRNDLMIFNYDNSKPISERWSLGNPQPGESAIQSGLTELTSALRRMQIVDVEPKPADLIAVLKGENKPLSQQSAVELAQRGFFALNGQLYSNEGQVLVQMNSGVTYGIMFGEIAENTGSLSGLEDDPDATATQARQLNRYVFVSAQFDESLLDQPEMPEILKQDDTAGADSTGGDNQDTDQDADLAAQKRQAQIDYNAAMKAYETKVEAGKEQAAELSDRFAGWYYIISDDVFEDIKVVRADVVETRVIEEKGYDLRDLNRLETQGIRGGL